MADTYQWQTPEQYQNTVKAAAGITAPTAPMPVQAMQQTNVPYGSPAPQGDPTDTYLATLKSIDAMFGAPPTETEKTQGKIGSQLGDTINRIASMGGSVGSDGQIDATGALIGAKDSAAARLGFTDYADIQNQLQAANSEIMTLQKEALAIPLQIQNDSMGRGRTAAGVAPIQADQLRTNAVKALTISATAQALQGNVARAEDMASKAVEAQFLPLQSQLNYLNSWYKINKDQLDREDAKSSAKIQAQLQAKSAALGWMREDYKAGLGLISSAAKNYPTNQAAQLAISKANRLDPNSPSYLRDVMSLMAPYQSDPAAAQKALDEHELNRAQIAQAQANIRKIEAETGKIAAEVAADGPAGKKSDLLGMYAMANGLISSPDLKWVSGGQVYNPFTHIAGGPQEIVKNQLKQLSSFLSLENRSKLKGSGAISDFESRTLARASSALGISEDGVIFNGGYSNLNENDLKQELRKVAGAMATASGLAAPVKITAPDGSTQTVMATRAGINAAIEDGLIVEYQ